MKKEKPNTYDLQVETGIRLHHCENCGVCLCHTGRECARCGMPEGPHEPHEDS
jgi:hypothetical protein